MAEGSNGNVLVIGSSNTDLVVKAHKLPAPGQTLLGEYFWTAPGGKGANQAVASVRAGAKVCFVARVGKDDFGKQALEAFGREGLNTTYVLEDPDLPSGVASILVDASGENCIVVVSGANAALSPVQIDAATQAFHEASCCLLQLESPLPTVPHAVGLAREHALPVILNPAPAQELPDELLDGLFLITPNETEVYTLTGVHPETPESMDRATTQLHSRGVQNVLITLGARGAYLSTHKTSLLVPAPQMQVVDTTGAGDAFNGALAAALAAAHPLEAAVRFAVCAGALAVTRAGAQPSLPTQEQIETLLEEQ